MDVHIDEPRKDGVARAVDALPRDVGGKFGDDAAFGADIEFFDAIRGDELCVLYYHATSSLVNRNRMAMRTAMPERT